MGADSLQDHRVLFFHSSITCIYFAAILLFLHFSDHLYTIGLYKFSSVLLTLVLAELVKLSFATFQSDYSSSGKQESKSKRTFAKTTKDNLKFVLAIAGITIIYYIAIVLFGAPLLTHREETLILALTLTALTLIPASLHLGIDNALALFLGSQLPISGAFVDSIKLNVQAVLFGAWLGAFVLPLDWDRPWQGWPIPCVAGALLGYFAAHFITLVKISTTKLKKKNKKAGTMKTC